MAKMQTAARLTDENCETTRQAATWERTANAYQEDGLCRGCAAQAAYGHQLGFGRIHPPCEDCQPTVAGLPLPAGRGTPWRKHPRGDRR